MSSKREKRRKKREKKHVEKKEEESLLIDRIRTDLNELQNEEIKNLKRENNELKVKYDELKLEYDELNLEHDELKLKHNELRLKHNELKLEHNELRLKHNELKLKFVKAEQEKEVNRKCRDFVERFLFKLSKKLNYDNICMLSNEYEYGNHQEVKKKIESKLEFIKMKANEFKQISDFRLSFNNYSHGVKKQSAYDAQIMLSNMDFSKDMEYLITPLNKVLKALQIWDKEN